MDEPAGDYNRESNKPAFWTGTELVRATGHIFYRTEDDKFFLEPYAAKVLGIRLVGPDGKEWRK
jgi:hypothetical protein